MSQRDLVPWTSMISGYVYEGNIIGAFRFFEEMRLELEPGPVTVGSLYKFVIPMEVLLKGGHS